MSKIFIVLSLCLSLSAFASTQEAWKGFSDPEIMSSGFTHKLSELPMEGMIAVGPKAWSGDYWASKFGGINRRWNTPEKEGFRYKSPTREQVAKMSEEELKTLSPTEKYDLFLGDYNYTMKEQASGSASPRAPDWAGICNGWAPAALLHNEPVAKTVVNPDGIKIPFGSADIKALLSYYYAFHYESETTSQVGLRCFFGSWLGGVRGCDEDLNAGAFHIIIANKLGIDKEGFIADVDRYKEVWNQPVVGFKTKVLSEGKASDSAARAAVRQLRVATELFYVDEADPTWDAIIGTPLQLIAKKDLEYTIEISAEGKIVGGSWISKERPDFLWNKAKAPSFEGILSRLPELLND